MRFVTGVFHSADEAAQAVAGLDCIGMSKKNISLLTRSETSGSVRTTDAEQPGIGEALGGVVGGALGIGGGLQLGLTVASALIPGVGPVVAVGMIAGALLGTAGAMGGVAVGRAVEDFASEGIPRDELFVYEDALRQGRTVLVALAADERHAAEVRDVLSQCGAESIDAAHEKWWLGLRAAQAERYTAHGPDHQKQHAYALGVEAARRMGGRPFEEAAAILSWLYEGVSWNEAFRRGYESGLEDYRKSQPHAA